MLVLSQAGGAWASGRPAECTSLDGGRGANVWERAKAPELRRYCDLLAAGAAKLAWSAARVPTGAPAPLTRVPPDTTSREVLEIAEDAERAMPGWTEELGKARKLEELPDAARKYIQLIEREAACPAWLVSVGFRRDETIVLKNPFEA